LPLGIRFIRRYPDNEACRMPQLSSMEKVFPDPVLSAFELPLRQTFYPFGFPLELQTNSADVIAAAAGGWGEFQQAFDDAPVRLCLGVLEGDGDAAPLETVVRSREHIMSIIADPENFVVCDFNRGLAFGWVTQNTAADHPLLRYHFLVAGGATLVSQRVFAPLHGGLVVRNGTGVMLTGDSLAGKSTLAYACARAGWTYVSDDGAFLVRGRDDRYVVGDPHNIRFRPDAPGLFPELTDRLVTIRPNGKLAIELPTRDLALDTAAGCNIDHVVYLNRAPKASARLGRICKDRVREEWSQHAAYGTQEVRQAQLDCQERLLTAQLWEMQYSDLDEAVARLEVLVDSGA
jgi:hypothetical protein